YPLPAGEGRMWRNIANWRWEALPLAGGGLGGGARRLVETAPISQQLRRRRPRRRATLQACPANASHQSRMLRKAPTDAEIRLWWRLRGEQLGVAFVRQLPIGKAVVDFACRRLKLAIELDGSRHADNPADEHRTRMIEAHGYRVIRFWNGDVLQNTDGVLEA